MSKEEYELAQELKKENEKEKGDDKKENADDVEPESIEIQWEGLDDRTVRLTKNSADITQAYLLKDASKLYYLKADANGSELWERDFREDGTKMIKKFGPDTSFEFAADEKSVFFLSGGSLSHAKVDSLKKTESIPFNAVMEPVSYTHLTLPTNREV